MVIMQRTQQQKKKESRTFKGSVRHYAETTTIKGLPKVLKHQRLPLKVLWLFAVLFGGGMAAYQLTMLLIKYFQYPSTTKLTQVNAPPEMPDVTFCNLNPLTLEGVEVNVSADDYSQAIMNFAMDLMDGDDVQYFKKNFPEHNLTDEDIYDISATVFSASGYLQSLPKDGLGFDPEVYRKMTFRDCVFYSWDMTTMRLACDNLTVRHFFYPDHLICFTVSVPEELHTNISGFSAILYLGQPVDATFPLFKLKLQNQKSRGMKTVIHPRHTLPSLTDGVSVPPGQETTIKLSPAHINLLPQPYGKCRDQHFLGQSNEGNHGNGKRPRDHDYMYTEASCKATCYQDHVIRKCACVDIVSSFTEEQLKQSGKMSFCGNTSFISFHDNELQLNVTTEDVLNVFTNLHCSNTARKNMDYENCSCMPACHSKSYAKSISQTPWPTTDHHVGFYDKYISETDFEQFFPENRDVYYLYYLKNFRDAEVLAELLRHTSKIPDHFLQVNVLFTGKQFQDITEYPIYTWDVILSNLGGTFNLWIGISFITVIELTELLYNVLGLLGRPRKTEDANQRHMNEQTREKTRVQAFHM